MSTRKDEMTSLEEPDRVYYATGVFLDAEDLRAEQTYHRGRLARALDYLHGCGTVAGLEVSWDAATDALAVSPGVAIDRIGRLIELPRRACVNVATWLEAQRQQILHPDAQDGESRILQSFTADERALAVDVFIRFATCERGRTPAFAAGPFDAIDATVPARLRDGWELSLVPRGVSADSLPVAPFDPRDPGEGFDVWREKMQQAVLKGWRHGSEFWEDEKQLPDASTRDAADPAAVFLARVLIPVTVSTVPRVPSRRAGDVTVDNRSRLFVYPTGLLVRWLEALQGTFRL